MERYFLPGFGNLINFYLIFDFTDVYSIAFDAVFFQALEFAQHIL